MNRREFLLRAGQGLAGIPMATSLMHGSPKKVRPNILICLADDQSFPHAGAYGCQWVRTPGFDRVAREGVLFSKAYTPNAKCAPSRACLLTGRNSWQLEAAANHVCFFPDPFTTFCEALAGNGYFVGHTMKGWAPGVVGKRNGQTRQLTGAPFNRKKTSPPAQHIADNDYAGNLADFLQARPAQQPFCFWFGSVEPHRPYEYEAGIKKSGKTTAEIDDVPDFWPDNETVRSDMLDYAFEIEYFDQHVQKMLQILQDQGELDNTLVVVTSDHGMPFPRAKGQEYEYSNHVPLAMMWKNGIEHPGRQVDDFVSFIDLAPTFLELSKTDKAASGMQPMQGTSLCDVLCNSTSAMSRDHVLIGKERHDVGRPHDQGYPIRGIFKGDYLYIHNFEIDRWPAGNPETGYLNCDGSPTKTVIIQARKNPQLHRYWQLAFGKRPQEELYNIKNDRDCIHNLADSSELQTMKQQLQHQLFAELTAQKDPRMSGQGHLFDEYPYADPTVRGFYERYHQGEKMKAGWIQPSDYDPLD